LRLFRNLVVALVCIVITPIRSYQASASFNPAQTSTLTYAVEWRLVRAGTVRFAWAPNTGNGYDGKLHVESTGLVSKLYKVNDDYHASLGEGLCVNSILIRAEEGKRKRETKVSFDNTKASYLERDLIKNTTVLTKELAVPECVHDYLGGLMRLRTMKIDPGQSVQVPLSDGKRFANVKVDARDREEIKTPTGTYKTIRYEVHMFNDVLISRKARMFVWLTDDSRRLPVQIRVRMQFLIGTINLALEKEGA
jgi:Protein of unknown function (DUF3108)